MKPKILLYAHDGSGFGHLTRISRLAMMLQKKFTCLVITGTREVFWFLSPSCEYIKLPSWDNMYPSKSNQNAELWLKLSKEEVINFRSKIIESIFSSFKPDGVIIDHLPYGLRDELKKTLKTSKAKKYLLLRGIFDTCDIESRSKLLSTEIAQLYNRFLIASDKRVIDNLGDFPLSAEAIYKSNWIGYMTNENLKTQNINPIYYKYKTWVVCSAGSGLRGESLFATCIKEACDYPNVFFDIVIGTRSNEDFLKKNKSSSNVRISTMKIDLPEFHKNCDIVITSGGYNSLIEAISGNSEIIVSPVNHGLNDEQIRHAQQLQNFYPLSLAKDISEISKLLKEAITNSQNKKELSTTLNLNGIQNAFDIIKNDFNIN